MAATCTITGTAGNALTVSAVVFTNITSIQIDTVNNMINLVQGSVPLPGISINAATTVSATKSGATWTLTIS